MKLETLLEEMSVYEKRELSYFFACKIAYLPNTQDELRELISDEIDLVFNVIDGFYSIIDRVVNGECSLDTQINFDPVKIEQVIEQDIYDMSKILNKYKIAIDLEKEVYSKLER